MGWDRWEIDHELQEKEETLKEYFLRVYESDNWTEVEMVREIKRCINTWKGRWSRLYDRTEGKRDNS